jgi:hypothetical protein
LPMRSYSKRPLLPRNQPGQPIPLQSGHLA